MSYTKPASMMRRPAARSLGDVWDDFGLLLNGQAVDASQADPTDLVNQTTSGTTTSAADFTSVNGACKPSNFPALAMVQEFQSQLNRVAQMRAFSKIAVDGAVGPATLALFRLVQSAAGGSVMGDPSSCMGVAPDVDVLAAQIRAFADTLGAPTIVAGTLSIAPPTILTKSGKTVVPPNAGIAGSLATLSSMEKVALVGVLGGIGYLMLHKPKKRRK